MLEQLDAAGTVVREHTDANAGGHDHAPAGQLDGLFERVHDALGHALRFVAIVDVDQNTKLVAAKSRHHIPVIAGGASDLIGNGLEQLIACVVAQAVVDPLEVIDIEKQHRQFAVLGGRVCEFFSKDLVEAAPIDQVGQRVVMRHLLQ